MEEQIKNQYPMVESNNNDQQNASNTPSMPKREDFNNSQNNASNEKPKKKQIMAIVSLILGAVAFIASSCCCCFPLVFSSIFALIVGVAGLVLGIVTLVKNGKSGKAICAIILSSVAILLALPVVIFSGLILTYIINAVKYVFGIIAEFI